MFRSLHCGLPRHWLHILGVIRWIFPRHNAFSRGTLPTMSKFVDFIILKLRYVTILTPFGVCFCCSFGNFSNSCLFGESESEIPLGLGEVEEVVGVSCGDTDHVVNPCCDFCIDDGIEGTGFTS